MDYQNEDLFAALARMVGEAGRAGLRNHPVYGRDGFSVRDAHGDVVFKMSVEEIERAIGSASDDGTRLLMELRLGVGAAAAKLPGERSTTLARLLGREVAPTRADREFLKRTVATELIRARAALAPASGTQDVAVKVYSRVMHLPEGAVGTMTQVDRRVVRSLREGVRSHRIHVLEGWSGGNKPSVTMLTGATYTIENERIATDGLRYDLVFHFDPLPLGGTVELLWKRDVVLEPDPTAPLGPFLYACTPQQPIDEATISVRLANPDEFSSCFALSDVYENDRNSPHVAGPPVHLRHGDVSRTWLNPPVGRSFGLRLFLRQLNTEALDARERRSA